jgi:hypothetical protein
MEGFGGRSPSLVCRSVSHFGASRMLPGAAIKEYGGRWNVQPFRCMGGAVGCSHFVVWMELSCAAI